MKVISLKPKGQRMYKSINLTKKPLFGDFTVIKNK